MSGFPNESTKTKEIGELTNGPSLLHEKQREVHIIRTRIIILRIVLECLKVKV